MALSLWRPGHGARHARLAALRLAAMAAVAALPAAAQPPGQGARVDVPPQALGPALKEYARQSGLNVVFEPGAVAPGARSPGVSGSLAPPDALAALLRGTGAAFEFTDPGTVLVRRGPGDTPGAAPAPRQQGPAAPRAPASAPGAGAGDLLEEVVVTGYTVDYAVRRSALGSKTDEAILDIPQSVIVFGEKLLAEQRPANLEDIVRNAPGLTTVSRFGGRQDHIAIRGFEMGVNRNGVLRNGVQSVSRVQSEVNNLARVEVLKGPASILYGRLEVGGIINAVTRKPAYEASASAQARVGSYQERFLAAEATGPVAGGAAAARAYASYGEAASFRDGVDQYRYVFNPSASVRLGPDTEATAEYEYLHDSRTMDRGLVAYLPRGAATGPGEGSVIPVPRSRFLGDPDRDRSEFETHLVWLTVEHRADGLSLTSVNHYGRGTENRFNNDLNPVNSPAALAAGDITRSVTNGKTFQDLWLTDNYGTVDFELLGLRNRLTAGATLRRDIESEARVARRAAPVNIYTLRVAPLPPGQALYEILRQASDYTSVTDTAAVYFSNRVDVGDRLKLFAGLRYEDIEQDIDNRELRNANGTLAAPASRTAYRFDPVAPRFGAVFQPTPEWSLYANYTESFSQQNDAFLAGTAVDLEEGRQYEAGVKAELLGGRLNSTLAVFGIRKQNITVPDPAVPNAFISIGEAKSRGVEFDVSVRPGGGWEALASYALIDSETVRGGGGTGAGTAATGQPLPGVARHQASVWAGHAWEEGPLAGLKVAGGAFHVGRRPGSASAQFFLPAYTRVDAQVSYAWGPASLQLNVNNLLDREYFVGARANGNIEPGAPRTFLLTLSATF